MRHVALQNLSAVPQPSVQKIEDAEHVKQDVVPDIKHQDIIYYMQNGSRVIKSSKAHIDLFRAISEMKGLDCNKHNYIGFVNCKTNECVQFIRKEEDYWYAEEVINHGSGWDGYVYEAWSDSKPIFDMVRQFFEESPWRYYLTWKMNRIRKSCCR